MADLPIINNLRDKFIPGRNHGDEGEHDNGGGDKGSPENDVLEQYRIALNTELGENILTPSVVSKVRFGLTQPKGFSIKQVEVFHNEVMKSVQWYIAALEKRDRDVHKLATEVDKYKTDVQNTRFQLEVLQGVGGQAVVDESGNYVTESQLSGDQLKVVELENRIAELENDLFYERKVASDLQKKLNEQPATAPAPVPVALPAVNVPVAVPTNADLEELEDLRQRQVELDEWEVQVIAEYERIERELEDTKALLSAKTDELASVKAELAEKTNSLREALENAEQSGSSSEEHLATIAALEAQVKEATSDLNEVLAQQETLIGERDAATEELENLRSAGPEIIQDEEVLAELEEAQSEIESTKVKIATLEKHISDLEPYTDGLEHDLEEINSSIAEKDALLAQKDALIAEKDSLLAEKDALIAEKEKSAAENRTVSYNPTGGEKISGYRLPSGITPEDLGLTE